MTTLKAWNGITWEAVSTGAAGPPGAPGATGPQGPPGADGSGGGGGTPTTRAINTTTPLTGGGDLSADRTLAVSAATETEVGVVELATSSEVLTGTDATRAVSPARLASAFLSGFGTSTNPMRPAVRAQTGTSYTLAAADEGAINTFSNAAPITVTVPAAIFAIGARIDLFQIGAGKVTVAAGASATVNGTPTLGFRAQYSAASLYCIAANTFILVGDLA